MLALKLGNVSAARILFEELAPEGPHRSGQWLELLDILNASELVEAKYGRGSLLDIDHPFVAYCVKSKYIDSEMVEAAERFKASELTASKLGDFVPGLERHEGRRLRK